MAFTSSIGIVDRSEPALTAGSSIAVFVVVFGGIGLTSFNESIMKRLSAMLPPSPVGNTNQELQGLLLEVRQMRYSFLHRPV